MDVNVLITSVSRKVWLVKAFLGALQQEKNTGSVITVDIDPLSAGFIAGDRYYLVPRSSDKDFLPVILDICKKEKISLIVPTRDAELIIFSENKSLFEKENIQVMVSPPEAVNICNDKHLFFHFLKENGFNAPVTYLSKDLQGVDLKFPYIVKSRFGSGSENIFKVNNEKELDFFTSYIDDAVIQEFIEGTEYTIDVFADFEGRVVSAVPRERIEVVSGESYKGRTVKDEKMVSEVTALAGRLGLIGHTTFQCIKVGEVIQILEINPRFGGGASLGFAAGVNTPRFLIKLLSGQKLDGHLSQYKEDVVMLRYTDDFFIEGDSVVEGAVL